VALTLSRVKKTLLNWNVIGGAILLSTFFYFSLPQVLFSDPYSTVLDDRKGNLLSAAIAADGQWRFPEQPSVPDKFKKAITLFEDKRFEHHPGVDLLAFSRAIKQNIAAGKVVSGGSTLSMQVIRLARKNRSRSVWEKIIELVLAVRLEFRYSKDEILSLYASHAPFGGNVVGLEAACWRYFGRDQMQLSWAEAAMLAVLPNNPSLIHLGKNRTKLKVKRDRLLKRLHQEGNLDAISYTLAISESIPEYPLVLPRLAPHLLDRIAQHQITNKIKTTIDLVLQQRVKQVLHEHYLRLKGNQIFNAAAVVAEVNTGNVLAYVGNVESGFEHQENVDVINSPRSTGSILKPFLYAAMLDEGKMLPNTLQPDIPIVINGFAPQNFSREYDGAVSADKALIRSLNIPAVEELRNFRYEKFYTLLNNIGLTTIKKPADHYGLSLILGGAEGTLWDITGAYASMARSLNNFFEHPGKNKYRKSDFHPLRFLASDSIIHESELEEVNFISAAAAYLTFGVLQEVYRPGEETGWRYFNSSKRIAWKTGTSHGFRDGWAIGLNADYVVGVWVGNADGEGRAGLTGTETAAPILFDVFSSLPGNTWFRQPKEEMDEVPICAKSGFRASTYCDELDTVWITKPGLQTLPCPYHKQVHLSQDKKFQVHSNCEELEKMKIVNWFVLPAIQEYYYKKKNIYYQPLPLYRSDCVSSRSVVVMDIIYPKRLSKIFLPRELTGSAGNAVFEAAHRNPTAKIFWHLDDVYIGSTKEIHKLSVHADLGSHKLTLVDENGETMESYFQVISN
jgi:penicillin-binding protein 1C